MEIGILGVAASGLRAQQQRIDFVGQNLANLDTTSYRALRPELVDVPVGQSTTVVSPQNQTASVSEPDRLVGVAGVTQLDTPGPIVTTGAPLDVALPPNVYLSVTMPNGQVGYTRNGRLQVDGQGRFLADGNPLTGNLQLQPGETSTAVDSMGHVITQGPRGARAVGTLPLVSIANPGELQPLGRTLYQVSANSGPAQPVTLSGTNGLVPGALEGSNTHMESEFGNLLRAQRAYEIGGEVIRTWDDLASKTIQTLGHA